MASNLEPVGVEAVVEGVQGFLAGLSSMEGGAGKLFGALGGLAKAGGLVGGALDIVLKSVVGLGQTFVGAATGNVPMLISGLLSLGQAATRIAGFFVSLSIAIGKTLFDAIINVIKFALSPFIAAWNAVVDVVKTALGVFAGISLSNLLQGFIDKVKELAGASVEAAFEFQKLELRLEGLLALQISKQFEDSGQGALSFGEAMGKAQLRAKSLFDWLSKLGIQTAFQTEDIANVFTLATSYGFAEDAAKSLTTAVVNFSSGMGLSGEVTERIIQNLGQMVAAGKITGTEIRDLARGAFVPVNTILERTAEILGITTEELAKLRAAGEQPPGSVDSFIQAFIEFSNESFPGAAKRLARTIPGVLSNLKELVETVVGFRVLKPTFDTVGGFMADFLDSLFTFRLGDRNGLDPIKGMVDSFTGTMGQDIFSIADRLGKAFDSIVKGLTSGLPAVDFLAEQVLTAFDNITKAVETLAETGDLEQFFVNLGVPQWVIDKAQEFYNVFVSIKDFIIEDGPAIVQGITDTFGHIWDILFPGGQNPFDSLLSGFTGFLDSIKPADVQALFGEIQTHITNFVNFLVGEGDEPLWDRVVQAIQPAIDALGSIGTALVGGEGALVEGGLLGAIGRVIGDGGLGGGDTGLIGKLAKLAGIGFDIIAAGINAISLAIETLAAAVEILKPVLPVLNIFDSLGAIYDAQGNTQTPTGETPTLGLGVNSGLSSTAPTIESFNAMYDEVIRVTDGRVGEVAASTAKVADGVIAEFERMKSEIVSQSIVPEMWGEIVASFTSSGGAVLSQTMGFTRILVSLFGAAATGIISVFSNAGTQAVDGLVNGLILGWAARQSDVEDVIKEIIQVVSDLLEIGSPSRVFANIGMQMASGMALGMQRGVPLVRAAMEQVMSAVPGSASMPFNGGSLSTNVTNYNVDMQSTNNFPTSGSAQDDLSAVLALLRGNF